MDGNFIFAGTKLKVDIVDRFHKLLLGAQIRVYIQRSALKELGDVGEKATAALDFARLKCDVIEDMHFDGDAPSDKLTNMLSKYFDFFGHLHLLLSLKNH